VRSEDSELRSLESTVQEAADARPGTSRQRAAWCLYDFGNSAFPTVIVTALYVLYFKGYVVPSSVPDGESSSSLGGLGDLYWGLANSLGAAVVFLTAPICGAIADRTGRKRFFLVLATLLCAVATFSLSIVGSTSLSLAVSAFLLAVIGFEASLVFYNAFLPELERSSGMARLSGKAWALGYIGGLGSLLVILPFVMGREGSELEASLRLTPAIAALWFLLFTLPGLVSLRDRHVPSPRPGFSRSIRIGFTQVASTLREARKHQQLLRFLLAYFFYNNGIIAVIVFAVAFTKDSLAFTTTENLLLVIVLNLVAAPGAYFLGLFAEKRGARRAIFATLWLWLLVVALAMATASEALFTRQEAKLFFWGVAILAALGIGATQATSRTFVGQLAPDGQSSEFYGLMAFSGKGSAILGPLVFGQISYLTGSQFWAIGSLGLFFGAGLLLLRRVQAPSEV